MAELLSVDGLDASPEITAHLALCSACRRLVSLAAPEAPIRPPAPPVARAIFEDWRLLHAGGMGRIHSAIDTRLGREVALKLLPEVDPQTDEGWRAELVRRFDAEARQTANLDHPGIVAIHEAGRFDDGEPFYVMPLIRGEPLDRAIEARRGLAERLALLPHVAAAADAVAYTHDRGIVHRDLKPQNLMIGGFGETVVIDWGLAQAWRTGGPASEGAEVADGPGDLTRWGVGTANYMAPEQAEGANPDPRMDVYGLGATLYHLLAGVPPYGRLGAREARRRLLAGPPPPLTTLVSGLPPALVDVTEKCMARAPAERFPDALELARELRRFLNGELTRTRRYTAGEVMRHWARRHRAPVAVASAAVLVAASMAVYGIRRIVSERNAAEAARRLAVAQAATVEQALSRAQGSLASRLGLNPVHRLDALSEAAEAVARGLGGPEPPPPEAVSGLLDALAAGPPLVALGGHRAAITVHGFDPRGRYLLSLADDAGARLWDARSGRLRAVLAPGPRRPLRLIFSPDGKYAVASGVESNLVAWAMPSAEAPVASDGTVASGPSRRLEGLQGDVADLAFVPELNAVAAADFEGQVLLWSLADGHRLDGRRFPNGVSVLVAGPGGRIAVGDTTGHVSHWDPRTGAHRDFAAHEGTVSAARWSPDGRQLLTCGADDRFLRWSLDPEGRTTGAAEVLLARPGHDCHAVRTSLDFRTLVVSLDGVHLARTTSPGAWARIPASIGPVSSLTASGDRLIGWVSADRGQCRIYDTGAGQEVQRLPILATDAAIMCSIAPDGGRVSASGGEVGELLLADSTLGFQTGTLGRLDTEVVSMSRCGGALCAVALDGRWQRWSLPGLAPLDGGRTATSMLSVDARGDEVWLGDATGATHRLDASGLASSVGSVGHPVQALCGGAGGVFLLSRGVGAWRLPDLGAAPEVLSLPAPPTSMTCTAAGPVFGLADGRRVARDGGTPAEVPVTTIAAALAALRDGPGETTATALSPDGRLVAAATGQGSLSLWSLDEGVRRFEIGRPSSGAPTALVFVPGPDVEPWLAVGHLDGEIRLYPTTVGGALDVACARLSAWDRPAALPGNVARACAHARPVPP